MCKFMYLQNNNLLPKVFTDYFTLVSYHHSYSTQNASKKNFTFLECTLSKDNHHVAI